MKMKQCGGKGNKVADVIGRQEKDNKKNKYKIDYIKAQETTTATTTKEDVNKNTNDNKPEQEKHPPPPKIQDLTTREPDPHSPRCDHS